jgi:hypothetical protein
MSSFSRNAHRANSARRSRALGAGLALALASTAALADGAHHFVFTAFSDAAGGEEVVAGRYDAALEELNGPAASGQLEPAAIDTNRCVAYSMTLHWQEARSACDAAVRSATAQRKRPPAWWNWMHDSADDYLAVAYANRAVMDWLWSEDAAARADLAKAQELSPGADFVARNVVALRSHTELAQRKARGEMALAAAPVPKS